MDEKFSIPHAPPAFGFDRDAIVSGGVLSLDNSLSAGGTAVRHFAPAIAQDTMADVSFDWKYSGGQESSGGIEFRDLYGRLMFALEGAAQADGPSQLRFSTAGPDSDSSTTSPVVEPTWTAMPLTIGKTYSVRFQVDFKAKTIGYRVADGRAVLVQKLNLPMAATGLERLVATSAHEATSNRNSIDNLVIKGRGDAPSHPLSGRTIYAFGDSIVAGHKYRKASFVDFVARHEGMTLTRMAVNGATVMPSRNAIADQVADAPATAPDYVLFDGGANDAYPSTLTKLGFVTAGFRGPFEITTFAGAFEDLIARIKSKYPHSKLVYVAIHKLGARDARSQEALRRLELAICAKWKVAVADLYPLLDTNVDANRVEYSFDSLQPNGLPGTAATTGSWGPDRAHRPTGTHPNLVAIEKFYAPAVSKILRATR
jgi:lysophospholipase L1-like esterase